MHFFRKLASLFTVVYRPQPDDKSFLERSQKQSREGLTVTLAVMSDRESKRFFGTSLARRGLQSLWMDCENDTSDPHRLDFYSVDPTYYTPLEAAHVCHYSIGKRLLSFGLLAWLFLLLLPLLPFKLAGAKSANRRMNELFKQQSFRFGPIAPGSRRSGVVFTALDEGAKNVDLKLLTHNDVKEFNFSFEIPGLAIRDTLVVDGHEKLREISEEDLKTWINQFARCTSNKLGNKEGDPLNLVVVGDRITIRQCFGGRWDEAESITFATCLKTGRAFLFDAEYRYSPVSSLYIDGKMQDLALQKARSSINERIHLRLWPTPLAVNQQPVWIGQISRDIGVRFTPKTWNLTTHRIDPNIDEARDYVTDFLIAAKRVSRYGYTEGVEPATAEQPRHNLTGDPYFTDGNRVLLMLSSRSTAPTYLPWS
ncbi:MAG: LssY C-terminal domain-containing protein [Pirellulaceae bacterium]|nr:LssY C-terminal domain-containing protein [Pirellulaceae bacterium]